MVNAQRTDYLRAIQREVATAERALSTALGSPVIVRGIIAVLAESVTIKQQPTVANVVPKQDIARWLRSQPTALSPEQVSAVSRVARLPSTWEQGPPGGVISDRP